MRFGEIIEGLANGRRYAREAWKDGQYIRVTVCPYDVGRDMIRKMYGQYDMPYKMLWEDIKADDWKEVAG